VFGWRKRKRKERKLRNPMHELGLCIGFLNFLSFLFLSLQPNGLLGKMQFA
jgi:hypothetical protein